MRRYSYQKNKKSRKEKIGFFTAFSICLVAVGLALWSTYASIGGFNNSNVTEDADYISYYVPTQQVGNQVTGITVTELDEDDEPEETQSEVTEAEETEEPVETEPAVPYTGDSESLKTMLQVSKSLDYPIASSKIQKEYSEEAVYSETMGDYRVHTGVDFSANAGDSVEAMCDGVVESIYKDSMYGYVIKVTNGNFSVLYCGMDESVCCTEGETIARGNVIGTVGEIPCESKDKAHLHIEVHVGDKSIDPLMVIDGDE